MTVNELLNDPGRWVQHVVARTSDGRPCGMFDAEAACWCITGAIHYCYANPDERDKALDRVWRVLPLSVDDLVLWNDHPQRTFREIRFLIEQANI